MGDNVTELKEVGAVETGVSTEEVISAGSVVGNVSVVGKEVTEVKAGKLEGWVLG